MTIKRDGAVDQEIAGTTGSRIDAIVGPMAVRRADRDPDYRGQTLASD